MPHCRAMWRRSAKPTVDTPACLIFAADHGVAKDASEGGMNCSSYPQAVSRKVLEGLDNGIAGESVLARCNGELIDEIGCNIVMFGEVGIGNTTTSSALIAALTGVDAEAVRETGASTTRDGINDEVIAKKISIIKEAMEYHKSSSLEGAPFKAQKAVGGEVQK
mmetsp:Transcript_9528/g.16598  ORF Transcript_9528/g.16598 Transcript_9528/m.16598 type:complete len:164 (-) Transcript_9528:1055-1546(-)